MRCLNSKIWTDAILPTSGGKMIDTGTCRNCGRPIFFDWKGAHHVNESQALALSPFGMFDTRLNFSNPECDNPEEASEED